MFSINFIREQNIGNYTVIIRIEIPFTIWIKVFTSVYTIIVLQF